MSVSPSKKVKQITSWSAAPPISTEIDCLCLGTGRFLRSVLVPALIQAGYHPALIQTRGRTMMEYMDLRDDASYEVDTVLSDGSVQTDTIACYGAYSLGTTETKEAVYQELLPSMKTTLSILGVGVTEAGMASSDTPVMKHLYQLLNKCRCQFHHSEENKLCVIDMDNVPNNGQVLKHHMVQLAEGDEEMKQFLVHKVAFLDTMVDRITSQREGSNGMVPRCEPVPAKALVILDTDHDLPENITRLPSKYGVLVRFTPRQLQADIALKLRVANGTHTAAAHAMALCKLLKTDVLSNGESGELFMAYLDSLFACDILNGAATLYGKAETEAAYQDWRKRLCHAHFGLSTFFITQNGAAKGGIRLGPTVTSLFQDNRGVSVAMAFAFCAIVKWLTPCQTTTAKEGVYRGWLEGSSAKKAAASTTEGEEYADGLRHDLEEGWYEFKCACCIDGTPISTLLANLIAKGPQQPLSYASAIRAYLTAPDGGNLSASLVGLDVLIPAIATLYARIVAGDGIMSLLNEMNKKEGPYTDGFATDCSVIVDGTSLANGRPLLFRPNPIPSTSKLLQRQVSIDAMQSVVVSEVASKKVIDLHTHLLPPSHGSLCCWGIDELLTYHYLVAEYFMTAPSNMSPESFYAKSKQEQADIIWQALFIDRSPVSEACRGVITTLQILGLQKYVQSRDLEGIRQFYQDFRDKGLDGAEAFSELVYNTAGVEYAIMTNIPFESNEAQYWRPQRKEYPKQYRSALRVDPLLAGDRATVEAALKASGYDATLEGARQYLRDWCDTMKPEYVMASTPHYMVMPEGSLAGVDKRGVNKDAMKEPFAFVDVTSGGDTTNCDPEEDNTASVIDENSDFLSDVLMAVCEERDLAVALKVGAHRGVNPSLKTAGDGVVAFADSGVLARLCSRFPKVRFLATFLSRNNQHEACVLASKFRNLHIYGCWWFCNNPSMIEEITRMRIEMLGTGFTAQHSDARVLDQLIYKWSHSRSVIAKVLSEEYAKLCESGWTLTRAEIRRDVHRLFGGSYEEFMSKSFA